MVMIKNKGFTAVKTYPGMRKIGNSQKCNYLPCFTYYEKMKVIFEISSQFYIRKVKRKVETRTHPKICEPVLSSFLTPLKN